MNYLAQIGWHGINVMTFKHRGQGLEHCSQMNCYTLTAISTLFVGLALVAEGNTMPGMLIGVVIHLGYMAMAMKMFSLRHVAGIACAFVVFALFRMFNATVAADFIGARNSVFNLWEPAAQVAFIIRSGVSDEQRKRG